MQRHTTAGIMAGNPSARARVRAPSPARTWSPTRRV
ncbi:hypothetical protein GA0115261_1068017 [Streptomyces sp. OspMP-M43]|nr:hypothetical protein GA0115261_1068017 [Streptomyces sp. OspMP-M43]